VKFNKLSKLTSWLLIFALIFGFIIPQTYHAETIPATGVGEATTITDGKVIDGAFEQPGVNWYKITPTKDEITKYSHLKIEVNSDQVVNVSVYSSKENAEKDQTFEQYSAGTIPGTPAIIQFPYAWDNTYYIKVEYYGLIENPDGTVTSDVTVIPDASLEGADFGNASYTLKTSSVKLPPNTEDASGATCPVESSVNGKSNAKEMLKDLRLFRDGILSKTEQGRQLSSLYYKSAPFLIAKLAFNKSIKDDLYNNLVVLQPLIDDLNKNGAGSSRVIR